MSRRTVVLAVLVPLMLVAGLWLGGHPERLPGPVRDVFVGSDEAVVVAEALDRLEQDYFRKLDGRALTDAAIGGAVRSLDDRFSAYYTPREYRAFKQAERNEFSGVGLEVRGVRDGLRVTRVFDGSGAKRAGLRIGDVILSANGHALRGLPQEAAVARVKGPPGSEVRLAVRRGEQRLTRDVQRSTVTVPVVESRILRTASGARVGVIGLSAFNSGAHAEVYDAIRRARKRGAEGLLLDLRHNGGGLVKEAQLVASAFLPEGPIVTTRGRAVPEETLDATGDPVAAKMPLVVLVDGATASAAEIVTGALQDRDRATVVGQTTFGKGVFQEVVPLSNGGALQIVLGRYFTPDGRNLGGAADEGKGLRPDVKATDDPDTERDEALSAALRELRRART